MRRRIWLLAPLLILSVTTSTSAITSDSFRIGPGDSLSIMVWDNKDLDYGALVRPDGKISLPLVGEVQAGGRTVAELTKHLTELYGRTVRSPHVTVDIKSIVSRPVYFVGGLERGGTIQLLRELTIVQGIALAGGLVPQADLENAALLRQGKRIPIDFVKLLQKGDLSQNLTLEPGDTVLIPIAESVTVQGEVRSPTVLKYTSDLTLLTAIVKAGGFTPMAAARRVTVLRGDGVNRESLRFNVGAMMSDPESNPDVPLRPNDIVIAPERWF